MRCIALFFVILSCSGCAGTIESLTGRAIMSDHLDKPHDRNKMRSQTGDRRTILFLERPTEVKLVVCHEPFAGAISGRGASSGIKLVEKAETTDAVSTTLLAVDQRAGAVRLFEAAAYEYCKRYQDGTLTREEYKAALETITKSAFERLIKEAEAPKSAASPATPAKKE